jgi:Flp pilus assembly protein TadG
VQAEIASILAFGVDRSVSRGTTALEDPTISTHARRLRRRRSSGQGLVEFAIVGGLLFFLIFSVMNAGFYLYGANAMQYAADIGVATIAAEGNYDNTGLPAPNNADTIAIYRMDNQGLNSTPLVSVTEVDIYKENVVSGVFSNASTCGALGTTLCENIYSASGVLQNGVAGVALWDPSQRNVSNAPDYAKLVIKFSYTLLVGTMTFKSTTVNLFRLEPQT